MICVHHMYPPPLILSIFPWHPPLILRSLYQIEQTRTWPHSAESRITKDHLGGLMLGQRRRRWPNTRPPLGWRMPFSAHTGAGVPPDFRGSTLTPSRFVRYDQIPFNVNSRGDCLFSFGRVQKVWTQCWEGVDHHPLAPPPPTPPPSPP